MNYIKDNLKDVEKKVADAALRVGRKPEEILLLPVTKTHPIEMIEPILEEGYKQIGENKVQEIKTKYEVFENRADMHMIGHLQQNKVKQVLDKVSLIHSVDSLRIAEKINKEAEKIGRVMDVLIQVNVAKDEAKYGFDLNEVEEILCILKDYKYLKIQGLMTIAPFVSNPEDNRHIFRNLNDLFVDIRQKNIDNINMNILSMGMTNDYEVAIEEGSNLVRVGTGIFGARNYYK